MDPDGSIYACYVLISVFAFFACLYTAATGRRGREEDPLGVTPGQVSGFLLYGLGVFALCFFILPRAGLWRKVAMGAVFLLLCTALPFCLGLALHEKLGAVIKIFSPLAAVMSGTVTPVVLAPVRAVFSLFSLNAREEVTPRDVMELVEDAHEDVIDEDQKEMIENIFELDDMTAGDIMTHRTSVLAFEDSLPCRQVIDRAVESGFSRIPVYSGTVDTVTGILYVKDLIPVVGDEEKLSRPVRDFARKPMFVPESCGARELLVRFKKSRSQVAVVVDEYGGTGGIVTMEDILEEIVGNIQDEFDNEEEPFTENPDGSYEALASARPEDALDLFGIESPEEAEDEDFDSIGGLVIDRLGRIPRPGEKARVEYCGLLFTVTEVARRRIEKVRIEKIPEEKGF